LSQRIDFLFIAGPGPMIALIKDGSPIDLKALKPMKGLDGVHGNDRLRDIPYTFISWRWHRGEENKPALPRVV
jgi:hypothetical protein